MALLRGHVGLLIDNVLEVIDHRAVGNEGQRPGQMAVAELAGILSKEAVRPRPREELHRHRVDLAGLHAGPYIGVRDAVAVHIGGKGMAGLMGHNLHIVLGAVEVGKDEGHLIIAQTGAVAAARLAGGGQHIHQLIVQHFVEELAGLGGKLLIEFLPCRRIASASPAGLGLPLRNIRALSAMFIGYCLPRRRACSR